MNKYVIIGNGIAGINGAEAIRSMDSEGSITMIASETFPPYSRPMISLLLQGAASPDDLPIRGDGFYEDLRIDSIIGESVTEIDLEQRKVVTNKGAAVPFDRLLIASGANPREIDAAGTDLDNISFMRTESDVRRMLEVLPDVEHALVLGGGLVGFKAAYGLLNRGIGVTMLIRSGHPLSMQLDPTAGRMVLEELIARGLDVRVDVEATAFDGNGRVMEAQLSDGSRESCDLVVIGKGVSPATSFVPTDRINVDVGILVNECLQTSEPDVFAAGDVAEALDVVRREPWVNAIWPVAVEQGRIAGLNMAGRRVVYSGSMGRNVLRVFDLDVLTGGLINPPNGENCRVLEHHDPRRRIYRRLVLRDDRLVGVGMVGRVEQGGVLLSLIQRQLPLSFDPEILLNPSFNWGRILY